MSLHYKFNKALKLLTALSPEELARVKDICEGIRQSQKTLLENATAAMQQCLHNCEGLCCRNAQVDDIIGLWDLVYILTLTPDLAKEMAARIEHEKPFYSADCMFLKANTGPCIFDSAIRPEVCVTTFCSGDDGIQKEIRRVKWQFLKLSWFFYCRRPRKVYRKALSLLKAGDDIDHHSTRTPPGARRSGTGGGFRGEKHG